MSELKDIQDLSTHARSMLSPSKKKGLSRSERLTLYKKFLKIEEHRIHRLHKSGGSGLRICRRRSDLVDIVLKNLYQDAIEEACGNLKYEFPLTIMATGGYGRGRLNPCSDVDIHFVQPKGARALTLVGEKMVENMLYMLYDCGFKVGHAVRSAMATIRQANDDHQTKSALIESRLIIGDPLLYDNLKERFNKQCISGGKKSKEYLALRLEDLRTRHAKFDNTVYLQEPHVKEGCGGLRDYQNLIWLTFALKNTTRLHDLVDMKLIPERGYREMRRAYDFLLRVRNDLHYDQKRSTDILTLRLQGVIAKHFNYPEAGILRKTESFMRDYYMHTRNLFQRSQELVDVFYLEEHEANNKPIVISFLARRKKKEETFDGFISKNNRLYPEHKKIFKENHHRLMRLFQHAQLRHLRMSPELFELVQASHDVVNASFRYSRTNRETFEAILSRRGDVGRALRQMHRVDFLGKYIPEFGALTNLVQHEFFHRYTADEHTLRVVEQLDDLAHTEDPKKEFYSDLFQKIEDPYILYLAVIMHDTGRAENTSAHDDASTILAAEVARRMRMISHRRKRLLFLVENHLILWRTATTRNLDDPQTISDFARIVKDQKSLDDLLLLTYADSKGTNSEGWTDWKESLIRHLYRSTSRYLTDREGYEEEAKVHLDQLCGKLSEKLADPKYVEEIVTHLENMPQRYFQFREAHMIAAHIRLCYTYRLGQGKAEPGTLPDPVVKWKPLPLQGCSRITVVSSDRPKLLAAIAGALASQKINVIGADAFFRKDGLVLDIFRVCTTNFEPVTSDKMIAGFEKMLRELLTGTTMPDFEAIARKSILSRSEPSDIGIQIPQRVFINNDANPNASVIEVQALDRLGLLHDIFTIIAEFGLDITNSRISTTRGAAIDSFYVIDSDGKKITDRTKIKIIEKTLSKALGISY